MIGGSVLCLSLAGLPARAVVPCGAFHQHQHVVNVTSFGAVGDGVSTNTLPIQNAINAAARGGQTNGLFGGTVEIPAGNNAYVCGPLCLSNHVCLQIGAGAILRMLPYSNYPGGIVDPSNFISGSSLQIEITGRRH